VVPLEPEFEGLMFMNIDNYAGGAHPWGAEKDSIVRRHVDDIFIVICCPIMYNR